VDVNAEGFLHDVLVAPERLDALLDAYERPDSPLEDVRESIHRARRVVLLGMGSSRFAAEVVAAQLRSQGIDAVAELASSGAPSAPRPGTVVVAVSAGGSTPETVEAMERHRGRGVLVAVTNNPEGPLAAGADHVLPLHAGGEEGGVACLTFMATLAVLQLAAGAEPVDLRPASEAAAALRDARAAWLGELVALLGPAHTVYAIAPAERISSALQSALMFREGPRKPSAASETGDWLHVDVYLSKRRGYTALLYPGSRFDGAVMEWCTRRGARIVAIGRTVEGAVLHVPFPSADDGLVSLLVETGVAELAAAELWRRAVEAGDPALV
jgi:fructoselysine-6-P-deglycase FrlB-like protein